jgi:Tol biopolymer transport system component
MTITSNIMRAVSAATLLAVTAFAVACGPDRITEPQPIPAVASVVVSPTASSVTVGDQITLDAQPKGADGEDLDRLVSWSSEDEGLATVSQEGVVTTLGAGVVGIRATSEGKYGRTVLTIEPQPPVPVAEVRLDVTGEILLEWDGRRAIVATAYDAQGNVLLNRQVEWSSTRPVVAAVNGGVIEAQNAGTATISAAIEDVRATVNVRVKVAPVVEVYIDASTTGIEVGETFAFGSRVKRANGDVLNAPASWATSNAAVARVDHEDLWYAAIYGVSAGPVTITATAEGITASMNIVVADRPTQALVYNRDNGTVAEILTLDLAAGGDPVRINAGTVSRDPSPSPDGRQIVFAVAQRDLTSGEWQHDLYIVSRDGLNIRRLTSMAGVEDQPQWSPNGSTILFRGTVNDRSDFYTINADGTGLTNLTAQHTTLDTRSDPAWSHDGTRIAFIGATGSSYKVWTMQADGSALRQVTTDAGFDMHPAWSADGTRIAFVRYNTDNPSYGDDIMIVDATGGTPARLAQPGDQRQPTWSADGKYIALSGTTTVGSGVSKIFTMRPDGTGLRLRTVNPASGGGLNPAWLNRP